MLPKREVCIETKKIKNYANYPKYDNSLKLK